MFSFEILKEGHRARDRQMSGWDRDVSTCFHKQPTTFSVDISSHCEHHSARPLRPTEMFTECCHRLSGIVGKDLCDYRSRKPLNGWPLTFHLCYNSLMSVFAPSQYVLCTAGYKCWLCSTYCCNSHVLITFSLAIHEQIVMWCLSGSSVQICGLRFDFPWQSSGCDFCTFATASSQ